MGLDPLMEAGVGEQNDGKGRTISVIRMLSIMAQNLSQIVCDRKMWSGVSAGTMIRSCVSNNEIRKMRSPNKTF